ncbi:hypothetical protein I7I50_03274 [Histoplasma capsulatum G186AR]|uniref:Uncharacterized protein n=1 Tax=Ajellomyces capsulatus TaxID=5037 RepID=A0A8H7Z275_AJECA|nr:hypothetical protein I7I52_00057 [Histoplasma capsulatum]QSS72179.1 hypothetical protein I7I50_03274 [Histoplasma capsulatum G186AR]
MPVGLSSFWRRTKSIIDLDFLTDDASSLFISAKRMITLFSIYRLTFHTRIHLGTMPISQLRVLSTPSNAKSKPFLKFLTSFFPSSLRNGLLNTARPITLNVRSTLRCAIAKDSCDFANLARLSW